jgi:pSer/pThr/pTyr-binding forkhead associated (FHA) protein
VLEIGGLRFRYDDLTPQASKNSGSAPQNAPGADDHDTARIPALAAQPAQPATAAGQLMLMEGDSAGQVFALNKAILTIGRNADCDIVIPEASISRQHVQIVRQELGWYVQDLSSMNGTAINGQRLSAPQRLEDGDTLTVGDIPLRYLATSSSEESISPEEPTTERLTAAVPPAPSDESAIEGLTTGTPTRALPPRTPTVPLRGRENPGRLRLPTRPLAQSSDASENSVEAKDVASVRLSNHVFRPSRLVSDRAHLAPINPPPADQ